MTRNRTISEINLVTAVEVFVLIAIHVRNCMHLQYVITIVSYIFSHTTYVYAHSLTWMSDALS